MTGPRGVQVSTLLERNRVFGGAQGHAQDGRGEAPLRPAKGGAVCSYILRRTTLHPTMPWKTGAYLAAQLAVGIGIHGSHSKDALQSLSGALPAPRRQRRRRQTHHVTTFLSRQVKLYVGQRATWALGRH